MTARHTERPARSVQLTSIPTFPAPPPESTWHCRIGVWPKAGILGGRSRVPLLFHLQFQVRTNLPVEIFVALRSPPMHVRVDALPRYRLAKSAENRSSRPADVQHAASRRHPLAYGIAQDKADQVAAGRNVKCAPHRQSGAAAL